MTEAVSIRSSVAFFGMAPPFPAARGGRSGNPAAERRPPRPRDRRPRRGWRAAGIAVARERAGGRGAAESPRTRCPMRAAKLVPALSLLLVCSVAGCVGVTGKTLGQNIDDATVTAAVKAKLAEEAWSNLV